MRVVTINAGKCNGPFRTRLAGLARGLEELDPDIVACQEVFLTEDGSADTAAALAVALGMHVTFARARRKARRLDDRSVLSWSGLALLSRHPWTRTEILPLPWDRHDGDRACLLGLLEGDGETLVVANLHLTHLAEADTLRPVQLRSILRHPWLARQDAVRLLCSDFNTTAAGPVLAPLLAEKQGLSLRDCYTAGAGAEPRATLPSDGRCIDYIFSVAEGMDRHPSVACAAVVLNQPDPATGALPSDHFGVLAALDPAAAAGAKSMVVLHGSA